MENKKNKIENIKETFTRDEIKIILYSISKNQDLAEKKFGDNGGYIFYINGDYNPADLGFHKPKKKQNRLRGGLKCYMIERLQKKKLVYYKKHLKEFLTI